MRLQSILSESINDKGILKAVFFAGFPGSGKSTVIHRITDGSMPVMVINSDIWTEYYLKFGRSDWGNIGSLVKKHTINQTFLHLNGLLPLFIDSTSKDTNYLKRRLQVLQDIGYDTKMIFVEVDYKTTVQRATKRWMEGGRYVDIDFIRDAYYSIEQNIGTYKSLFPDFKTIRNEKGDWENIGKKVSNEVFSFFNSPVKNEQGKKLIDFMREKGYKYYSDIPKEEREEEGLYDLDKSTFTWAYN